MVAKISKKRNIIYVDAAGKDNNTSFKISMVDVENEQNHVLEIRDVTNNTEAEKFAVFYAIFYIEKHGYENCHILCDNQSAVSDSIIQKITYKYAIGISWIPREVNGLADTLATQEPTIDELEWNQLRLFISLLREPLNSSEIIVKQKKEIEELKNSLEQKKQKIKNQTTQLNNFKKRAST